MGEPPPGAERRRCRARWPAPWLAGTTTSTIRDEVAEESATQVAAANLIWNEAGVPVVSHNCPAGVTGSCTRVDVYRDADHGNPIDMLFGPILGITSQGVRATATAIVGSGNATDCLRPIAFADDWVRQPR